MSNKLLKDLAKISKNIKIKDLNNNLNNLAPGSKWKIEVEGEVKDMSKMTIEELAKIVIDGFKKVDNIEKDVKDVKTRLDVLESFHKNDLDKLKSQNKKYYLVSNYWISSKHLGGVFLMFFIIVNDIITNVTK